VRGLRTPGGDAEPLGDLLRPATEVRTLKRPATEEGEQWSDPK